VSFAVIASANHFWLDVVAGMIVGGIAMALVYRRPLRTAIASLL
jgi:membrane-associated phospholipid phosphatase